MSSDVPRASATGPGATSFTVLSSDQVQIPTHVQHVPGCGDVLFHHAQAVNVSSVSMNDGAERIALVLAQPGCQCGCGGRGRGLLLTPDAEGARVIARWLVEAAERQEREAATAAAIALRKAAGR